MCRKKSNRDVSDFAKMEADDDDPAVKRLVIPIEES
jgi:hypothetical protein